MKNLLSFFLSFFSRNRQYRPNDPYTRDETPFEISRITTAALNYPAAAAIKGKVVTEFDSDDISMGVLGYAKSTGSKKAALGHIIGTFGLAEDNPDNHHYLIGVEGRVNGSAVNKPEVSQTGTLGVSTFIGVHFDKSLYKRYNIGVTGRSEIYSKDGETPLNEGVGVNFYAPAIIGGAAKFSIMADEQGWFKNKTSIQLGTKEIHEGSILFASTKKGDITLKPEPAASGNYSVTIPAITGKLIVAADSPPKSSKSEGSDGQIAFDENYFYWYTGSRWNRVNRDENF